MHCLLWLTTLAGLGACLVDVQPEPGGNHQNHQGPSPHPVGAGMVKPGTVDIDLPAVEGASAPDQQSLCPGCNILLISVCSLRVDAMDLDPEGESSTPAMRELSRESLRFDHAYAASNFTLSSLTALLTGRFPSTTGVLGWGEGLGEGVATLPEVLGVYGYRTGGFATDAPSGFRPDYGLHRGFQRMQVIAPPPDNSDGRHLGEPGPGGASALPVVEWFQGLPEEQPFFAMFHSRTAHYPFLVRSDGMEADSTGVTRALWEEGQEPPAGSRPGMAGERGTRLGVDGGPDPVRQVVSAAGEPGMEVWKHHYADAVARTDKDVEVLLDALQESGRADNTIVLLVADHGESLGDHGEILHGDAYFSSVVHIPMLLHIPGREGGETSALVSHVDLLPTLLELVGAVVPAGIDGHSLLPLLTGTAESIRSVALVEGGAVWRDQGSPRGAVVDLPWTLLVQDPGCVRASVAAAMGAEPNRCLFNLDSDPAQTRELSEEHPEKVEELLALWTGFRQARKGQSVSEELRLDPDFVDLLQASGYDFRPEK